MTAENPHRRAEPARIPTISPRADPEAGPGDPRVRLAFWVRLPAWDRLRSAARREGLSAEAFALRSILRAVIDSELRVMVEGSAGG